MSLIKFGETRLGKLTIVGNAGRYGATRIFECLCDCGETTHRTLTQLLKRNQRLCEKCRGEYVAAELERKREERSKHAHYQSARS